MLIVDKYFRLFLKDSLKKYDMNSAEGLVLLVPFGESGLTQDQLIDELQYDKRELTKSYGKIKALHMYLVYKPFKYQFY